VNYAAVLGIQAKEETVLQGMFGKLIKIENCCGMKTNVEKTKVMRISWKPSPLWIVVD
jgi:hypothetical protein